MKTLSIITINKNNGAGLEKTIQSVICQTSNDFEYIVIDGASDDESVEIIAKYADRINYWVSERDTGVYNAMNKGIRKAQGKYCLFLNSGDWLISPETLKDVFEEIRDNSSDIFYSDVIMTDGRIRQFQSKITINYLLYTHLNHQNTIIKCSLFSKHFYNENLNISSDWEFFLHEYWNNKSMFHKLKTNIAIYDTTGISSRDLKMRHAEDLIVYHNVFNDLADIIIEHRSFCKTIYYGIITDIGNTKLLSYLLRIYRKSYIIARRIGSIFYYQGKKGKKCLKFQ